MVFQIRGTSCAAIALRLTAAFGALAISGGAQAQDDSGGLQDIIVTAQKRAENVQDIPISINAFSGDAILERRISDPTDLVRQLPNLSFKQSSSINAGISVRGVGTQNYHLTAQQAVGQYLDEVSLVTPFSSAFGLYDLERIEVLRGPQNTLFGRNTTGGAINYVSRRPDVDAGFNGYARTNIGRWGRVDLEGAIGVPLGDTLAIRVAGQMQRRNGVFRDVAADEKIGSTRRYAGRFGISWQPEDGTELLLSGHVGYNRGSRGPRKAVGYFQPDGVTPCALLSTGTGQFEGTNDCVATRKGGSTFNPSLGRWRDVYDSASNQADVDFEGGFFRLNHSFGGFSITSISSFDRTKVKFADDSAATPYIQFQVFQDAKYDIYSHETRFTSEGSGPLKWIVGGYWSYEKDGLATAVRNDPAGPAGYAVVPMVILDQKAEIVSFYGQFDYALTDRLNVGLGLRWTGDRRKGWRNVITILDSETGLAGSNRLPIDFFFSRDFLTNTAQGFTAPCVAGAVACKGPVTPLEQNLSKVAGKISLDYTVADDVMTYASFSRGFKSGSFDVRAQGVFNGSGNTPVRPEILDAYEIGLKSRLFDRMMQFNAAAFRYDWKNLQAFGAIPGIGPAFLNVPKARLTGVEADIKLAPGGGFVFDLAGAYLDSKLVDVGNLGAATAIAGAPLQQSPRWSFNGGIEKTFAFSQSELNARLNARYVGAQYSDLTKAAYGYVSSAFFMDASVAYRFGPSEEYEVSLYVDNIMSEKTCYRAEAAPGLTNVNTCMPNEGTPLYGFTATVRW